MLGELFFDTKFKVDENDRIDDIVMIKNVMNLYDFKVSCA
jgi:hypothetical protein